MQVVSVVSGIFFKARIAAAMAKNGMEHSFCGNVADMKAKNPTLIILDLEHPNAKEILENFGSSVIAFGPHMQAELLAIGRNFGAQVYSRSAFFNNLDHLLSNHA